jgi:hypothetical protein
VTLSERVSAPSARQTREPLRWNGCAISAEQTVKCWGYNFLPTVERDDRCEWVEPAVWANSMGQSVRHSEGKMGPPFSCRSVRGAYYCRSVKRWCDRPAELLGIGGIVQIEASKGSDGRGWCARTSRGELYCWGDNPFQQVAQLGRCDPPADSGEKWWGAGQCRKPVRVEVPPVTAFAMDAERTCAVTSKGEVYCWGGLPDGYDQKPTLIKSEIESDSDVGSPPTKQRMWPNVKQVVFGPDGLTALSPDGFVLYMPDKENTPKRLEGVDGVVELSKSCARTSDGAVYCWCRDFRDPRPPKARRIPGIETAVALAEEQDFSCALLRDGRAYCWGFRVIGGATPPIPVNVSKAPRAQ